MSRNIGWVLAAVAALSYGERPDQSAPIVDSPSPPVAMPVSSPPAKPVIRKLSNVEAMELAWRDIQTLPAERRALTRYLWVPSASLEDIKAVAFTLNALSRSSTIKGVWAVSESLLRVQLDDFAPTVEDLAEWLTRWEDLRFDPAYSLLLTSDTFKLLGLQVFQTVRFRQVKGAMVLDRIDIKELKAGDVARTNSVTTPNMLRLQLECGSEAAIVDARYFVVRTLSTIKDQLGSKEVFGGLYYELVGVDKKPAKGTAQDAFLAKLGAPKVVKSDQRLAMFRSDVTGKPRRADFFYGTEVRPSVGAPLIFLTHDVKDGDIDNTRHPMLSLLNVKDAARELIATKPNGFQYYALFAGNGDLQDEAPPDVVVDRTVPAPHTPRLQIISCIRCHGSDDGLKPMHNDVPKLNVLFDNLGGGKLFDLREQREQLDAYKGEPAKALNRGRDDYAEAVLRAVGPWRNEGAQAHIVRAVSKHVGDLWNAYAYDTIGAEEAIAELLPNHSHGANAAAEFTRCIPVDPRFRNAVGVPEDGRIMALKAGLRINRSDWAFVQGICQQRLTTKGQ